MVTRRKSLKIISAATISSLVTGFASGNTIEKDKSTFTFCLNTSTIKGQGQGLIETIKIADEAGYDGIEIWLRDIDEFLRQGKSLNELKRIIQSTSLKVEGAIGFAPWIVDDTEQRENGFVQMEREMNILAKLGCKRIAAPPAGFNGTYLDFFKAGERYKRLLDLGRKTGVMPHLEFWGGSGALFHFGQALHIAAAANDPDVRILADVYHMYKGGSGYDCLKMIHGNILEMFHLNDFLGHIPREQQNDSLRVFPGDGAAPFREIFNDLYNMGGNKVLSLELFNPDYWKQDALKIAKTGLDKMKKLVSEAIDPSSTDKT